MVSMYVSFTPHLLHPGSRDLCTPWMLRIFLYIDVLTCVIYNCMYSTAILNSKDDWSCLCLLWFLLMKTGRWMHRYMVKKPIQPTETVDPASLGSAYSVWEWKVCPARLWADCSAVLWRSYWHRHDTELTTEPCVLFVEVEPYRLTVRRHHRHCWLCSYNINQLRLAPSIPWMH